ncbi:hypothetical protein A3D05_02075 [Candidatus Gottesmanbacteria bacterium RIFCSPHIGHO2_02_FULL_40_24]|uniref:Glycosyltransferase 2-like domain-containing protein n=1 Tax=Candidatus Gottesmanbacteria bacterium RIFCSPHIGHO2_01_FULL_40_15 TaxID=1798376 RepID=A0A1F5Z4D6_9BACT|nr:MAG: hypothetical protein A2777_04175 [Candidatus Gottesmanbacteria bacterium RIFCSPHIGHO2_01_FULL_40_15]OGG18641.1 MAG: hypothetical protein A3D05_02075 [Candidatus Gottesmanbacteria bacterium RIFCSPHIGHO2_02_FULL_40_24]OGG22813.1 MAG: hypothetical protein A3B48_05490 [Candidatus Gottesmanbacteria bacterium RIFCSPLOWO2_01_FULL_40_10]OGG24952.1 MAG: hypothetical protein A3E42_02880 [Candidatus Gottesmanbacteria bacterium RIFCSPHIGHO2_12_FULL_40_13]OGG31705.1 MAG: hypothetical protein A3I80_0
MKISVVIPAYNEEKFVSKTLESIEKTDKKNWDVEIVVVDGGSTDRTASVAKEKGARVIHEPHKGIGFARQHGLLHATGEIVIYTDADTVVPRDWLTKYMKAFENEEIVCTYGTYRVSDGKFPYFQATNYLQPWAVSLYYRFGIYFAGGQNIAARRDAAIDAGGFDEKLEQMEDADFVKRMSKAGKIAFLPDNIVISSGRRSKEGISYFLRAGISDFKFFILGKRDFLKFPDYR